MNHFQSNEERLKVLSLTFADVYEKYPCEITQQQAAEICAISVQTIRKWEKFGDLPFKWQVNKLIHYHTIQLDDLLTCLYEKSCMQEADCEYISLMQRFYENKYKSLPSGLLIKEVAAITGYGKTTIVNWINQGKLKGYNRGRVFRIPKKFLVDFVCSSYYRKIKRQSSIHKADIQNFLEINNLS